MHWSLAEPGHLGSVIARILGAYGAHVLVNSRDEERAAKLVHELRGQNMKAETAVFDVSSSSAVENYFVHHSLEKLHVLVNCAYAGGAGTVQTAAPEEYMRSFQVSVVATQIVFANALPALRRAVSGDGDASVINISSMYGLVSPKLANYASPMTSAPPFHGAAKAALLQWTRYAACEFAPEGIRVNSISPGAFPSAASRTRDPHLMEKLKESIPVGRLGEADEIRSAIMFLASPASRFVTGSNVVVDGGWTSW